MRALDAYYDGLSEPQQGCLLALRQVVQGFDQEIVETWKWKLPFFLYRNRMFCYFWIDKKTRHPYMGIVGGDALQHPALVQMHRAKIRKLIFDPHDDLPVKTILEVLDEARAVLQRKYG